MVSTSRFADYVYIFTTLGYSWTGIGFPDVSGPHLIYLFSLSGALVLLNSVPCYALDGQWILQALIELLFRPLIPSCRQRRAIFLMLIGLGTLLVAANLLLALTYLFIEVYGPPGGLFSSDSSTSSIGFSHPQALTTVTPHSDHYYNSMQTGPGHPGGAFHQSVLPTLEHPFVVR
ncbi:unnamed protein product [Protopolystoma xenopodis]|uniref:Uncharacterized protein n=1 Tax=Protopolystoma xenopodis TaxID=117903 RepID=A0A3S5BQL5_9PLAT|nr:unnamed protein product [Protopolystoma xenopodis]